MHPEKGAPEEVTSVGPVDRALAVIPTPVRRTQQRAHFVPGHAVLNLDFGLFWVADAGSEVNRAEVEGDDPEAGTGESRASKEDEQTNTPAQGCIFRRGLSGGRIVSQD